MLGLVKEISGQKTIIPLTTDTGTGAPVGTLISQYKKVPMSGYLYCDGSTFDETAYPALYLYLGTNVLPDYRECVMVGAEQNTTDAIAEHDVYAQGQFKDDQIQEHYHHLSRSNSGTEPIFHQNNDEGSFHGALMTTTTGQNATPITTTFSIDGARSGTTTHGKQKAVFVYIKATSGLAENQQENVLNAVKNYVDNSNSYSTSEILTGGTWIDGKPIYRKVIDCGAMPNNTTKNVATGLDFTVCNVVKMEGFAKNVRSSDSTDIINVPYSNEVLLSTTKTGDISVYASGDFSNFSQSYVTIEYTKTTD